MFSDVIHSSLEPIVGMGRPAETYIHVRHDQGVSLVLTYGKFFTPIYKHSFGIF